MHDEAPLSWLADAEEPIPFVRPCLPDPEEFFPEIRRMFAAGMLTKGQHLDEFERRLADHLQVQHAVCVSSCTVGLMLSYQGLKLAGEVVVPSFTFMATVSAMSWVGLRPVFVEVDPQTTNIEPADVEAAITPRTSAIVAVHNFGNPAPIAELEAIAARHGLKLLFDAAHGFGSRYRGVPLGGQGDVQVFSLSPTKLVVAGEGGVVATNDAELAEHVRLGREYGNDGNYNSRFAGLNGRMPELSALVGLRSLGQLDDVVRRRNEQARLYQDNLAEIPGLGFTQVHPHDRCSFKDFSIVVDEERFGCDRDVLAQRLASWRIDTRKYYDPPVHQQSAYVEYASRPLPRTEALAERSLSLPIGHHVSDEKLLHVCRVIRRIHELVRAPESEVANR